MSSNCNSIDSFHYKTRTIIATLINVLLLVFYGNMITEVIIEKAYNDKLYISYLLFILIIQIVFWIMFFINEKSNPECAINYLWYLSIVMIFIILFSQATLRLYHRLDKKN